LLPCARQIYRLPSAYAGILTNPQSHFGVSYQKLAAVLDEVERIGIPRIL
jgi:hypothetical protein